MCPQFPQPWQSPQCGKCGKVAKSVGNLQDEGIYKEGIWQDLLFLSSWLSHVTFLKLEVYKAHKQ